MTLLSLSRRTALLLVAASSLFGVACAGESAAPTYTPTDIEGDAATAANTTPIAVECTTGDTRDCKIYLGQHGDTTNCIDGLDVCSGGEWTGCIDPAALEENPELVSQLTAD
ncbi:MAG TPA: hypothetical protein VNN80_13525 [Polyangiaceae bacterium]|jgi:hypothetical protein|nr:hypothetical protein [Polyangiaceae bacterium]